MDPLDRFVAAQADSYPQALAELRAGAKRSHWMWWVFPQIAGLGRSETARCYAIADLAEARAYRAHPLLGARLIEAGTAMLGHAGRRSAEAVLGGVDAIKLRSCATLFEVAGFEVAEFELAGAARSGDGALFAALIDGFFGGERDPATLALLGR